MKRTKSKEAGSKNPHAVALGKLGGGRQTPKQQAHTRANVKKLAAGRNRFWAAVRRLKAEGAL